MINNSFTNKMLSLNFSEKGLIKITNNFIGNDNCKLVECCNCNIKDIHTKYNFTKKCSYCSGNICKDCESNNDFFDGNRKHYCQGCNDIIEHQKLKEAIEKNKKYKKQDISFDFSEYDGDKFCVGSCAKCGIQDEYNSFVDFHELNGKRFCSECLFEDEETIENHTPIVCSECDDNTCDYKTCSDCSITTCSDCKSYYRIEGETKFTLRDRSKVIYHCECCLE